MTQKEKLRIMMDEGITVTGPIKYVGGGQSWALYFLDSGACTTGFTSPDEAINTGLRLAQRWSLRRQHDHV